MTVVLDLDQSTETEMSQFCYRNYVFMRIADIMSQTVII